VEEYERRFERTGSSKRYNMDTCSGVNSIGTRMLHIEAYQVTMKAERVKRKESNELQ
jgi:hypothetical protein